MTNRISPQERVEALLEIALAVAEFSGWVGLTHAAVAEHAQCSPPLVVARLGSVDLMRERVMRHAVARENLRVLAEGLVYHCRVAQSVPAELKARVAKWLEKR
jgi:DNA-binding transcriptional regulator YbjK